MQPKPARYCAVRGQHSPPPYRIVLFHRKALQSLQHASLPAFLHLLHAALPLQEQLHNRVGGVDLVIFRSDERLQLRRKRLGFCGMTPSAINKQYSPKCYRSWRQHVFTCPIANALLELKQLGEVLLQRRLCGVDVDVHVARRIFRHCVHLMVSPSRHLHTYT